MENNLKEFLIKLLENDEKASINRVQNELCVGFIKGSFIMQFLRKNNVIGEDSKVLLTKEEINALELGEIKTLE